MKGIQEVKWKNQDGTLRTRYRVRISRKDFKADKLFDSLLEAKEFLYESKHAKGITRLEKAIEFEETDFSNIGLLMEKYLKKYFPGDDHSSTAQAYRLNKLLKIKVNDPTFANAFGSVGSMVDLPRVSFGSLPLKGVSLQTANELIEARLNAVSKATVRRDLSALQAFWNRIKHFAYFEWKKLEDKSNPFEQADRMPLAGFDKRKSRRLEDGEEEKLLKALQTMKNPEMLLITLLALSTGMRRGEVLSLEWSQIKKDHIYLPAEKTKARQERNVVITEEAKAIISMIPKKDERVFHYTVDGFNTNWLRLKKRQNLTIDFHSLRREFVSRVFEKIASPILVSKLTGMINLRHINESYLNPMKIQSLDTESGLRSSTGHADEQIQSRYINLIQK